jgi:multimeric flavodoxin WrbA
MKVLCINGSPKRNGSSSMLIDEIIDGMGETNVSVTIHHLGDMKINYCIGCKNCHRTGKCIQNDDVDIIIQDLIKADLVIIASPSYWGDITGQLKVFFDRNTPYSDTNPNENKLQIPHGKIGLAVAVRAGQTDRENIHILESIEHYFGHLGIKPIGRLSIKGVDTIEDLLQKPEDIKKAYELGKGLYEAV